MKLYQIFKSNHIDHANINDSADTPGIYIRKYLYNLNNNIDNLKKIMMNCFIKLLVKIIDKFKNNHIQMLKKLKYNLVLKNDIKKMLIALKQMNNNFYITSQNFYPYANQHIGN